MEVPEVPRGAERDASRAGDEHPDPARSWSSDRGHEHEERKREDRGRLGRQSQTERDGQQHEVGAGGSQGCVRCRREERGDDQVVVRRERLHRDDRQRGDEKRAEQRLARGEADATGDAVRRETAGSERNELRGRGPAVAAGEHHRGEDPDLRGRWVPVEPWVARARDVPDPVLLAPERRTRQVIQQRVEVERRRRECESDDVRGAHADEPGQRRKGGVAANEAESGGSARTDGWERRPAEPLPGPDRGGSDDPERDEQPPPRHERRRGEEERDDDENRPTERDRGERERDDAGRPEAGGEKRRADAEQDEAEEERPARRRSPG